MTSRESIGAALTLDQMSVGQVYCIIGAGLAGARAAGALREQGFDGRLVLVGAESDPPYDRPPLSKAYLQGQLPLEKLWLRPATYYLEHQIELVAGVRVQEIDRQRRRLRLSSGVTLPYDRLLIATGSRARELAVEGHELAGVGTVRSLADADRLRRELARRPRVLVVGAGFLGCEIAASARTLGCAVEIVEVGSAPIAPLGELAGRFVLELHSRHGVPIRCGRSVVRFLGTDRVEAADLDDGSRLACDLVVVCVGAAPNCDLAAAADLGGPAGIPVDPTCRTSDPRIFAAGDVASLWQPRWRRRLRLEHWDNAHRQGLHAAGSMLGGTLPYLHLPYFWSEQYDTTLQLVGVPAGNATVVVRGDPGEGRFSVFYLVEGVALACVAINRLGDLTAARRLVATGRSLDPEVLSDAATDLRRLASELEAQG